jgi:signal transduction histidine kinase
VRFDADAGTSRFTDTRAEVVYRIAEEALRNVDRHAKASQVEAQLKELGDGFVELTISDDGVGFDTAAARPGHFGLTGIREQAQLIDAHLELASRPQAGTTLRLRLRMDPEANAMSEDGHDRQAGGGARSALA